MRTAFPSEAGPGFEDSESGYAGPCPDMPAVIRELLAAFRSLVVVDPILNLVAARIAQLNRCAPSLTVHAELARLQGEHPVRLYHLSAWRDSNLFGPRERAALEWAEAVTLSRRAAGSKPIDRSGGVELSPKDISNLGLVVVLAGLCSRLHRLEN